MARLLPLTSPTKKRSENEMARLFSLTTPTGRRSEYEMTRLLSLTGKAASPFHFRFSSQWESTTHSKRNKVVNFFV